MIRETTFVIAEDDPGHLALITRNLQRAGITNKILSFVDGQQVLDFLFQRGEGPHRKNGAAYLLLLDISMPKVDGTEVLRQIKENHTLRKMPVIIITTTDDPREIARCHEIGCNSYITKPIDSGKFVEAIRRLGLFLQVVEVAHINGN